MQLLGKDNVTLHEHFCDKNVLQEKLCKMKSFMGMHAIM